MDREQPNRLANHPPVDSEDRSRALGGIEELGREDQLAIVTGQAQQQFPLRDGAGPEVDDRLAVQLGHQNASVSAWRAALARGRTSQASVTAAFNEERKQSCSSG